MGNILEYIKNIGFFLILVAVVCNALPENGFKKYCRLFCGLVLVILVMSPINELLNFDGDITNIFTTKTYGAKVDELEYKLKLQEQLEMDNALEEYEKGIADVLEDIATDQGLEILDVKVSYTYESEDIVLDTLTFVLTENQTQKNNSNVRIEEINKVQIGADEISDIDDLSLSDRPKVIKFVEEAAKRLEIEASCINIIWEE